MSARYPGRGVALNGQQNQNVAIVSDIASELLKAVRDNVKNGTGPVKVDDREKATTCYVCGLNCCQKRICRGRNYDPSKPDVYHV